jgi:hypothetical protein
MRGDVAAPFMPQGIAYQQRTQIRAADADVHHMPEFLAGDAEFPARSHRRDEIDQLLAGGGHLRLNGFRPGEIRAQRRMQHRTLLGAVDGIAAKHGRHARRQAAARARSNSNVSVLAVTR